MTAITKYDQLRLKTDKQLVQLIHDALDLGICSALEALESAGRRTTVDTAWLAAKNAHVEASRLLRVAGDLGGEERRTLESKQERLRGLLSALNRGLSNPLPTERDVSTLAHALWEARGGQNGIAQEGRAEDDWFRAERALKRATACVAG